MHASISMPASFSAPIYFWSGLIYWCRNNLNFPWFPSAK